MSMTPVDPGVIHFNERRAFEYAAYERYFFSTINRDPRSGFMVSGATMTQDQFCAKNGDGSYVIQTLDAAWWAWQERAKR